MKFTEAKLEEAIISLLEVEGYTHVLGETIERDPGEVLIKDDLRVFLSRRYADDGITDDEINSIIRRLETLPSSDLYETNKKIMKMVSDGFLLKREDRSRKDLYVQLIDYQGLTEFREPDAEDLVWIAGDDVDTYKTKGNICKVVNQFEIHGYEKRIPGTHRGQPLD